MRACPCMKLYTHVLASVLKYVLCMKYRDRPDVCLTMRFVLLRLPTAIHGLSGSA